MASKRATSKGAASADNEIDELFSGIGDDKKQQQAPAATNKTPVSAKPGKAGDDILAELENQLGEKPKAPSRPHTPRVPGPPGSATAKPPRASLDELNKSAAPASGSTGPSRKSADSARSLHASFTPSATSSDLQETEKTKGTVEQAQHAAGVAEGAGGGWWGGFLSTATAAMKQAEQAVKEIQQNEEAKKYLESVRGNVGALRGLGKLLLGLVVAFSPGAIRSTMLLSSGRSKWTTSRRADATFGTTLSAGRNLGWW